MTRDLPPRPTPPPGRSSTLRDGVEQPGGLGPPGDRPSRRAASRARAVLFYAGVAVLALLAAGATFFAVAPLDELVRDRIIAEVKAKTGRDLVIAGPTSFTVYPTPGLTLRNVSLSTPGDDSEPALRTAALEASLQVWPLLQRQVTIERLVLHEPVLDLHTDAQGRRSWERVEGRTEPHLRVAQAAGTIATDAGSLPSGTPRRDLVLARLQHLDLREVRIEDGAVRYRDARTGSAHQVEGINARLAFDGPARAVNLEASLAWRAERVEFDGRLTSPESLISGQPAQLTLSSAGTHGTATYDGTVSVQAGLALDGTIRGETNSARALVRWLGARLPAKTGFARARLESKVTLRGSIAELPNANLMIDGTTAAGAMTVDLTGAKPLVRTALQLDALDLNPYAASADGGTVEEAPPSAAPARPAGPTSIEDLLNAPPGPRVKGFARRGGWNEEPFEAGDLDRIDLDARLAVGEVRFRNLKTGPGTIAVTLNDSILQAKVEDLGVYDGRARGIIRVDASGEEPTMGVDLIVERVSMQPLLRDTAELEWLAGTGNLSLALAGKGRSERAIIETLGGQANFTVADGTLSGWALPQLMGAPRRGSGSAGGTEFSELAGSVSIKAGVAHNQDLRIHTQLARITGAGTIWLADRQVDYVLRPRLAPDQEAPNGAQQRAGLEVPVTINGSWDDPRVTTDLSGVVQNPRQAWEAIKEIGKQLKGKKVDDVVRGLLGR